MGLGIGFGGHKGSGESVIDSGLVYVRGDNKNDDNYGWSECADVIEKMSLTYDYLDQSCIHNNKIYMLVANESIDEVTGDSTFYQHLLMYNTDTETITTINTFVACISPGIPLMVISDVIYAISETYDENGGVVNNLISIDLDTGLMSTIIINGGLNVATNPVVRVGCIGNKIFATSFGLIGDTACYYLEVYDTQTNSWSVLPALPSDNIDNTLFAGNSIYVVHDNEALLSSWDIMAGTLNSVNTTGFNIIANLYGVDGNTVYLMAISDDMPNDVNDDDMFEYIITVAYTNGVKTADYTIPMLCNTVNNGIIYDFSLTDQKYDIATNTLSAMTGYIDISEFSKWCGGKFVTPNKVGFSCYNSVSGICGNYTCDKVDACCDVSGTLYLLSSTEVRSANITTIAQIGELQHLIVSSAVNSQVAVGQPLGDTIPFPTNPDLPFRIKLMSASETRVVAEGGDASVSTGNIYVQGDNKNDENFDWRLKKIRVMQPYMFLENTVAVAGSYLFVLGGSYHDVNSPNEQFTQSIYIANLSDRHEVTFWNKNNITLGYSSTGHSVATIDDDDPRMYVIGGYLNGVGHSNKIEIIKLSGRILANVTLPVALRDAASVAVGNNVYIFGGTNSSNTNVSTIYKYDTTTDTCTILPVTMSSACSNLCAILCNGKVYIFAAGGSVAVFDPNNNTCGQFSEPEYAITEHFEGVAYDGYIYLVRYDSNVVVRFDPQTMLMAEYCRIGADGYHTNAEYDYRYKYPIIWNGKPYILVDNGALFSLDREAEVPCVVTMSDNTSVAVTAKVAYPTNSEQPFSVKMRLDRNLQKL